MNNIINTEHRKKLLLGSEQYDIIRPTTLINDSIFDSGGQIKFNIPGNILQQTNWTKSSIVVELSICQAIKTLVNYNVSTFKGANKNIMLSRNPIGTLFQDFKVNIENKTVSEFNNVNVVDAMIKTITTTDEESTSTLSDYLLQLIPNSGENLRQVDLLSNATNAKPYSDQMRHIFPTYYTCRLSWKPSNFLWEIDNYPSSLNTQISLNCFKNWRSSILMNVPKEVLIGSFDKIFNGSNSILSLNQTCAIGVSINDIYIRRNFIPYSPENLYNSTFDKNIIQTKVFKEAIDPSISYINKSIVIPQNTKAILLGFSYDQPGKLADQAAKRLHNLSPTDLSLYANWRRQDPTDDESPYVYAPIYFLMNKLRVSYAGSTYFDSQGILSTSGNDKNAGEGGSEVFNYFINETSHIRKNQSSLYSFFEYNVQPLWFYNIYKPTSDRSEKLNIEIELSEPSFEMNNVAVSAIETCLYVVCFMDETLSIVFNANGEPVNVDSKPQF